MNPSWPDWNKAIGHATFSEQKAGRVVYLAVDGEEIGRLKTRDVARHDGRKHEQQRRKQAQPTRLRSRQVKY